LRVDCPSVQISHEVYSRPAKRTCDMINDTVLNENEFKGCFEGRFEGMVVERKGQRRKRGIDDLSEIANCV